MFAELASRKRPAESVYPAALRLAWPSTIFCRPYLYSARQTQNLGSQRGNGVMADVVAAGDLAERPAVALATFDRARL